MSSQNRSVVRRRRRMSKILVALAIAPSLNLFMVAETLVGADNTCGCELNVPVCGCDLAVPSCGCESQLASCDSAILSCKSPCQCKRAPSFAEKFLKKLDRFGDKLEAKANSERFTSAGPNCGCDITGPSCRCESRPTPSLGMPGCGCGPSIPFSAPSESYSAPPIPPALRMDPSKLPETQRPLTPLDLSSPIKRSAPTPPMFPNKSPENQARGNISDQSRESGLTQRPVATPRQPQASSERPPLGSEESYLVPTPVDPPATSGSVEPFQGGIKKSHSRIPSNDSSLPHSNREPFQPKQDLVPKRPSTLPNPTTESTTPGLSTPRQFSPPRATPQSRPTLPSTLPQSQDEIPDVLVDPFKDDISSSSRRDRMNSVRLSSGKSRNEIHNTQEPGQYSKPRLELVPPDDSVKQAGEILILPPSDTNQGVVIQSTFESISPIESRLPVPKRVIVESENAAPKVNRIPVPRR